MTNEYKPEPIITCHCGHWFNTTIPCPDCETTANMKWNKSLGAKNE